MLDVIFPKTCIYCNLGKREILCEECKENIEFLNSERSCKICGEQLLTTEDFPCTQRWCGRCIKGNFSFYCCRSVAKHKGIIKELVHQYKYRKKIILGEFLSDIIINNFPKELECFDIVVPVPLSKKKLRKREYNQSAIFAKHISKHFNKKYDPFSLVRLEDRGPQFEVKNFNERKRNVKNVFKTNQKNNLSGARVLLVDDVFTSGSTVNECTKVLLDGGAEHVKVLTLTRTGL